MARVEPTADGSAPLGAVLHEAAVGPFLSVGCGLTAPFLRVKHGNAISGEVVSARRANCKSS